MGRLFAVILVVVIVAGAWMYFTDTDIENGEIAFVGPEVTRTGTQELSVDIPTYDVDAPDDDANGEEDEVVDDDGVNIPNDDDAGEPEKR
ncbi:hypothetical protein FF098_012490 [Parvularcula flava]|uniref:Uncharacterized protein n=1 Tax=Aquisalinus luteolus TaxID=1566827 RepID=A0A8J3ERZ5_9PROT|nr:hypothetical protein [Aquisalinus luteolus]NHK28730.1 hypothetical protein [Aquisalinus luteolus]GGH99347.1 hypothetical protein GCM10011355_25090 [Aquisalinus luteolus]